MAWQTLFREKATTKVAAIFDTQVAASTTATRVKEAAGLQSTQLLLIEPYEKDYAKKLEPETQGVARTALRAHLVLGLAGLVAGALIWIALYSAQLDAIRTTPGLSALAFLFFGAIAGMLLGGLITARPDHQLVVQRVQAATGDGRWSLVIHPRDAAQCDAVIATLAETDAEVARSV
ncbi:MAG TPA: hypothetical protein VL001_12180 [Candidimonas sp.]|nr:hypothetical protein [Candidimonas sp.]